MDFERALEFIGEARAGISWERFSLLGVRYAEELINLARATESARSFLQEKGVAEDYAIRNARDMLYRLHFNRDNDHYLALGLPHSASEHQINRRWKDLMLIYHPDRYEGNDETAYQCATRVNEAYNILKDPRKKAEYETAAVRSSPSVAVKPSRRFQAAVSADARLLSSKQRRIFAKMVLPLTVAASLAFLFVVYIQNRPPGTMSDEWTQSRAIDRPREMMKEESTTKKTNGTSEVSPSVKEASKKSPRETVTELVEKQTPAAQVITSAPPIAEASKERSSRMKRGSENRGRVDPKGQETARVVPSPMSVPGERRIEEGPGPVTASPCEKKGETATALAPTHSLEMGKPSTELSTTHSAQAAPKKSEQIDRPAPHDPSGSARTAGEVVKRAQAGQLTQEVVAQLVDRFVAQYTHAYNMADINAFIALYSRSAVERGTMNYNQIRQAYARHFEGSKFSYVLKNYRHSLQGENVILSGSYVITKIAGEPLSAVMSGTITWTLKPEKDALRIVRVEYGKN